jgi:hypothetical protein
MAWTIKNAEGSVVAIEVDLGNAEELRMFLNEVADITGEGHYTLNETTQADRDEVANLLMEALR